VSPVPRDYVSVADNQFISGDHHARARAATPYRYLHQAFTDPASQFTKIGIY